MVQTITVRRIIGIIVLVGIPIFLISLHYWVAFELRHYTFFAIGIAFFFIIIYKIYNSIQAIKLPVSPAGILLGYHESWIESPTKRDAVYSSLRNGAWRRFNRSDTSLSAKGILMMLILIIGLFFVVFSYPLDDRSIYSDNVYKPKEINGDIGVSYGEKMSWKEGEEYAVCGTIKSINYEYHYLIITKRTQPIDYNTSFLNWGRELVTVIILEEDNDDPINYIHYDDLTNEFEEGDEVYLIFTKDDNKFTFGGDLFISRIKHINHDIFFITYSVGLIMLSLTYLDVIMTDWLLPKVLVYKIRKSKKTERKATSLYDYH